MANNGVGLNLGAGPLWRRPGWKTIDHKHSWWRQSDAAWRLSFGANSFDWVFSSHMLEHIPHPKVDAVLKECNRVLKLGGKIRIICPNLEVFARAYVNRDSDVFDRVCDEDPTIRQDLGFGGKLMNFIISPGADSFLFSRNGEIIGGYAHVYSYDFEMMKILLERHGFGYVRKSDLGQSEIEEMREPLHVIGSAPVWRVEREWPDRSAGTTGFDRSPHSSLFVEATKVSNDTTPILNYGTRRERGLDPLDMGWGAMTAGYFSFTFLKLKNIPRMLVRSVKLASQRPNSSLHRVVGTIPSGIRLSLKKWSGLG